MNGNEFISRAKRYGKKHDVTVRFDSSRGKGSHGTLHLGSHFTVVKDRRKEIGPGLLTSMLRDLNIDRRDF